MLVKKATKVDKQGIAICLVESFYSLLKNFSNDKASLNQLFLDSLNFDTFYVLMDQNNIAGCLSIIKHPQTLGEISYKKARKLFGFIKGILMARILQLEISDSKNFPNDGYINMLSIHPDYQGKGLAKQLVEDSLKLMPYKTAVLNLIDTNEKAYNLYKKMGFNEFLRKPEKFKKQAGFNEKIYMKYSK